MSLIKYISINEVIDRERLVDYISKQFGIVNNNELHEIINTSLINFINGQFDNDYYDPIVNLLFKKLKLFETIVEVHVSRYNGYEVLYDNHDMLCQVRFPHIVIGVLS